MTTLSDKDNPVMVPLHRVFEIIQHEAAGWRKQNCDPWANAVSALIPSLTAAFVAPRQQTEIEMLVAAAVPECGALPDGGASAVTQVATEFDGYWDADNKEGLRQMALGIAADLDAIRSTRRTTCCGLIVTGGSTSAPCFDCPVAGTAASASGRRPEDFGMGASFPGKVREG